MTSDFYCKHRKHHKKGPEVLSTGVVNRLTAMGVSKAISRSVEQFHCQEGEQKSQVSFHAFLVACGLMCCEQKWVKIRARVDFLLFQILPWSSGLSRI